MDLETQLGLTFILTSTATLLGAIIGLLLLYVVIRQGVFHGLRAHTRWVDDGKDTRRTRLPVPQRAAPCAL